MSGAARSGWRTWLPRVLVESALIVFSVLLALAMNEWRDARSNREQARTAEAEIVAELRANRARVDEAARYHNTLLDSLQRYGRAGRMPTHTLFSRGFVAPAQLSHTAWSSAVETGALSHMDYDAVLRLSDVYAQQERYGEQVRSVSDLIYRELYENGTMEVARRGANLFGLISTFAYRESELLSTYDSTVAALP